MVSARYSSSSEPESIGAEAVRPRNRVRPLARVFAILLPLLLIGPPLAALGSRKPASLPWTVRIDVHWGATKNREAYREGFARVLLERMVEENCFDRVVDRGPADLVLDVQLNEFDTEQEYATISTLLPGQGEEHQLIAAHANVNLDFWLTPEGRTDVEIVSGHVFREITRQAQSPSDPAETRALKEVLKDATGWVTRRVCDEREKLSQKITNGLNAPAAPRAPSDATASP